MEDFLPFTPRSELLLKMSKLCSHKKTSLAKATCVSHSKEKANSIISQPMRKISQYYASLNYRYFNKLAAVVEL